MPMKNIINENRVQSDQVLEGKYQDEMGGEWITYSAIHGVNNTWMGKPEVKNHSMKMHFKYT
jgi:hypothetical protein